MPTPEPFAIPADITSRWIGPDAPDDTGQLTVLIADAAVVIRRDFPDIDDRLDEPVDDGGVSSDEVRLVVVAMVTRLYRNPEGLRSTTDTTGPFTAGKTFAGPNPGALTLTDAERAILAGSTVDVAGSAFTIDLTAADTDRHYLGGTYLEPLVINAPEPW